MIGVMDWTNIILTLESNGMTRDQIAEEVGCSRSMINALALGQRGKRLSYEIGVGLKSLFERLENNRHAA
ncbi:XRE family transcriptional regulator [Aquitalea magnusonii]|uniref:XRE family transcriptional regulator n=2 Tax=Aquitalea aquatica TaxID=3044273 RepID=A0A838XYS4_9NEIS|nr:XRE family transcriptional regulator [Aquitalea magnusonii]